MTIDKKMSLNRKLARDINRQFTVSSQSEYVHIQCLTIPHPVMDPKDMSYKSLKGMIHGSLGLRVVLIVDSGVHQLESEELE